MIIRPSAEPERKQEGLQSLHPGQDAAGGSRRGKATTVQTRTQGSAGPEDSQRPEAHRAGLGDSRTWLSSSTARAGLWPSTHP